MFIALSVLLAVACLVPAIAKVGPTRRCSLRPAISYPVVALPVIGAPSSSPPLVSSPD